MAHGALRDSNARLEARERELETRERDLDVAREQVAILEAKYRELLQQNEELRHRIDALCRARYGRSSEKVDAAQLALAFAQLEAEDAATTRPPTAQAEPAEPSEPRRPRKGHGRRPLPRNLPRERIEYHPDEADRTCQCCSEPMAPFGAETSETLDYVPASYKVIEHVRFKYACRTCQEGVVIAPPAAKVIEKGLAGPGLVADVIVGKFADHLPLHRQSEIMARQGIDMPPSTLLGFVQSGASLLEPLARRIGQQILESSVVHADETSGVTRRETSGTFRGYLVAVTDQEQVHFRFQRDRTGAPIHAFFSNYSGSIVADEYAGYDALFLDGARRRGGCWAHARRGFFESLANDPSRAGAVLALIAAIYRVEREAKAMTPAERLALRQATSAALVDDIRDLLDRYQDEVLPRSPVGKAVTYALGAWPHLILFLEDGRVPIDNSPVERAIRPVAVGRKNWNVFGSVRGGECAATLYTLVGSCKLQKVNPFEYLRDVLMRVSTHPASRIDELTPRGWRATGAPPESAELAQV